MEQENKSLPQEEELTVEEATPFEPSPKWKRVTAWILFGIVMLGTINWLVSIAYPQWPQRVMEFFR
jgi:hypothetical protein